MIVDTAGRLQIDERLMEELREVRRLVVVAHSGVCGVGEWTALPPPKVQLT